MLTLAVPVIGYADVHVNNHPTKRQQLIQSEKLNTENHPLFVQVIPPEHSQENAVREEKRKENEFLNDEILTGATIILAVFTAGLFIVTYLLVRDAKETSKRQAAEVEKSLTIATQSVQAAERTAQLIEANAERQLRAYVSIDQARAYIAPVPTFQINAELILKNTGQTPAYQVAIWHHGTVVDDGASFEIPEAKQPNELDGVIGAIGANGQTLSGGNFGISGPDVLAGINNGTKIFYLFGVIYYNDIFGREIRTTRFRLKMLRGPDGIHWVLYPTKEGNEAT